MATVRSPNSVVAGTCGTCKGQLLQNKKSLPLCSGCKATFHLQKDCSGYSSAASWAGKGAEAQTVWMCAPCKRLKGGRASRSSSSSSKRSLSHNSNGSLSPAKYRRVDISDDIARLMQMVADSNSKLDQLTLEMKLISEANARLTAENGKLREEIEKMKVEQRKSNDYNRRNNVVLHGVSEAKKFEDAIATVQRVAEKAGTPLLLPDIDACHALQSRGPPKIVCRLVSRLKRDQFYLAVKKAK